MAFALLMWEKGKKTKSAFHLQEAFQIAREKGFYHFIFLNHNDLIKVCLLSIELEVQNADNYINNILRKRIALVDSDDINRLIQHPKLKVKRKARKIISSIHRKSLPKLKLVTLDGFSVYRDEQIINDDEWGGNLPKLILKLIVAHGAKRIPKDLIMSDIWPDENRASTETNFKVNLHRLRKILEPSIIKEFGSSYIHLNENLISLDEHLWQIDINEFYDNYKKGNSAVQNGNIRKAITYFRSIEKIYITDFLKEDIYINSVSINREELRKKYLYVLHRLAELYEQIGSLNKATTYYKTIINIDSISETACQKLILNYSNRGKHNEAIKVFEKFRETLNSEMELEPEELTYSIYKKIKSSRRLKHQTYK
jgi:DNA-binding SARP family transcriptional activator